MTNNKTKYLVRISVLSTIAFILMYIDFPIPIFPGFLKFDVSDVPALLGTFSMGPVAGVVIQLLKNILHAIVKGSETGGVGQLANFITGSAWVIPVGLFYSKVKTRKTAIFGLVAGAISMIIVAAFANYFILLPFYAKIMPVEAIVALGSAVNAKIVDFPTLILYGITPFNIFKTITVSLITLAIYKKISPILHK
ncbi:ECF transporter S component [Alkalibaculum sp. M08DMB]|uniref:Riboflavin transporter n=1 Tax=Alkalibaculum sporogenes TaxID=2655001 RepID=A0A6A7K649_9FIRM|nr:ECF transporter S component [Alkalibaculum sporogenes]MPW24862.1 ECF transporter S component [Alkalibaculum sporogenes]